MSFWWIVLLLSSFLTAYIIGFYPALVAILAVIHPRSLKRGTGTPSVSIVLAVHNGETFLRDKLTSILGLEYPVEKVETIVVDDGSTDRTSEIASHFSDRITLLRIPKTGKSGAVNQGLRLASGDIIVLTDVRQRLASDSLRYLMENFADSSVGVVSAELQIQSGSSEEEANTGLYWKYEKWMRLNLSAIDSIFGATGSYYALRRELAVAIPVNILNDDMYLPLHAFFRGYRLIVDRRAQMFDYPTGLAVEFGRKVRTLAGNYQILRHYPQLLTPRNRMLLHFLSYKMGRLLLPFAVIGCAASSLLIGGPLAAVSALAQASIYGLALFDPQIPAGHPLKRFSSPIRTFIVMMLASLCAISIWFVPPERLWRPTRVSHPSAPAEELH